jgi:hypothetical protein
MFIVLKPEILHACRRVSSASHGGYVDRIISNDWNVVREVYWNERDSSGWDGEEMYAQGSMLSL